MCVTPCVQLRGCCRSLVSLYSFGRKSFVLCKVTSTPEFCPGLVCILFVTVVVLALNVVILILKGVEFRFLSTLLYPIFKYKISYSSRLVHIRHHTRSPVAITTHLTFP